MRLKNRVTLTDQTNKLLLQNMLYLMRNLIAGTGSSFFFNKKTVKSDNKQFDDILCGYMQQDKLRLFNRPYLTMVGKLLVTLLMAVSTPSSPSSIEAGYCKQILK